LEESQNCPKYVVGSFLGDRTISVSATNNCLKFGGLDELEAYLQKLPEYEAWGLNNAKSVQSLWEEIQLGESAINQAGQRLVRVVVAEIRRQVGGDKILMELEQTLADGRKRIRSQRPMAEKIIDQENPKLALVRGLAEELSLQEPDYSILTPEPVVSKTSRMSGSYPGVMSQYERYIYQVLAPNLPEEDFTIVEPDGIRSATWGWREPVFGE
jgi:hypothetical protein